MSIRFALAAAAIGLALAAAPTTAAVHEYCLWDGSFAHMSAGSKCFQSGDNWLIENYAYEPYGANGTVFCAANSNGSLYGTVASRTTGDCRHSYSGGVLLKAWEYLSVTDWSHGVITY